MKDRSRRKRLDRDTWASIERSSAHPVEYAIALVHQEHTIRLFDNAHAIAEHHEHRYIGNQKQPPTITYGDVNAAMAAAEDKIRANWQRYVEEWKGTR